jgi:hypothetical protein
LPEALQPKNEPSAAQANAYGDIVSVGQTRPAERALAGLDLERMASGCFRRVAFDQNP